MSLSDAEDITRDSTETDGFLEVAAQDILIAFHVIFFSLLLNEVHLDPLHHAGSGLVFMVGQNDALHPDSWRAVSLAEPLDFAPHGRGR